MIKAREVGGTKRSENVLTDVMIKARELSQEPVGNTDDFRIFQENFKKKESFRRFPGQQRYDPSRWY
jgi:hypothetical protein